MNGPNISEGASDQAKVAAASLGVLGRLRLKLAVPFFWVAMALVPPAMKDAMDRTVTKAQDEEE
ncbi:hypothetical protein K745_gp14 [Haloarcula hispanica virus PH1]|uniref:Uncharacterized protein n=1 Tax=Haloarcula hispanica virus PH1 TaxID=1282967 RepID=M4JFD9_9VIRU|nr:hypothetical protein K745_gp14 [Haloarcula hispanica virus PH1]AGC65539.1 hypothetical protein HhPH1_gp14 [Haloarcula hispanica virus PH1]